MNFNTIFRIPRMLFSKDSIPYVIFYVTSKCNSKCVMCFIWRNIENSKNRKELSLEEIEKISKNMGKITHLSLSGGEPTLRDDLAEIAYIFYKNNHPKYISIPTNSLLPDKIEDIVKKIVTRCKKTILKLTISVDDIGENNDKIRGVPGAFDKTLETYFKAKELQKKYKNLQIIINTTLSKYNQNNIKNIHNYFRNKGIDQYSMSLVRGDVRNINSKDVDLKKFKETIDYLEKFDLHNKSDKFDIFKWVFHGLQVMCRKIVYNTAIKNMKFFYPCKAGKKIIVIDDEGTVFPCELLNINFGNLRDFNYNIKELLKTQKTKKALSHIKSTKCRCTWECAITDNIIFNFRAYPRLLLTTISLWFKRK